MPDYNSDVNNPNNDLYYEEGPGSYDDDYYDDDLDVDGGCPDGGFPDGDGGSW